MAQRHGFIFSNRMLRIDIRSRNIVFKVQSQRNSTQTSSHNASSPTILLRWRGHTYILEHPKSNLQAQSHHLLVMYSPPRIHMFIRVHTHNITNQSIRAQNVFLHRDATVAISPRTDNHTEESAIKPRGKHKSIIWTASPRMFVHICVATRR